MRKNAISWRRTICGSILEILCPVVLMFLLVYIRTQISPTLVGNFDIYQIKKPFFPIATIGKDNNWTNTNSDIGLQGVQISNFLGYTEYKPAFKSGNQVLYNPLIDPLGPYYFFPPHCFQTSSKRFSSPIIAYIA